MHVVERQTHHERPPAEMWDDSLCVPTSVISMEWTTPIAVEAIASFHGYTAGDVGGAWWAVIKWSDSHVANRSPP